jgi:hypothetical protein
VHNSTGHTAYLVKPVLTKARDDAQQSGTIVTPGAVVGVEASSATRRRNLSDSIAAAAAHDWKLT